MNIQHGGSATPKYERARMSGGSTRRIRVKKWTDHNFTFALMHCAGVRGEKVARKGDATAGKKGGGQKGKQFLGGVATFHAVG